MASISCWHAFYLNIITMALIGCSFLLVATITGILFFYIPLGIAVVVAIVSMILSCINVHTKRMAGVPPREYKLCITNLTFSVVLLIVIVSLMAE